MCCVIGPGQRAQDTAALATTHAIYSVGQHGQITPEIQHAYCRRRNELLCPLPGTSSDRVQILNQIRMMTDHEFPSPLGIVLARRKCRPQPGLGVLPHLDSPTGPPSPWRRQRVFGLFRSLPKSETRSVHARFSSLAGQDTSI